MSNKYVRLLLAVVIIGMLIIGCNKVESKPKLINVKFFVPDSELMYWLIEERA